jgi:hypothetical protein
MIMKFSSVALHGNHIQRKHGTVWGSCDHHNCQKAGITHVDRLPILAHACMAIEPWYSISIPH